VDPVKYYEYRGMGLPVLTTRFGQMASRAESDGVYAVDGPQGIAAAATAALAHRTDADTVARFRAENDWAARLEAAGLFAV
jgi:hypothetical protein